MIVVVDELVKEPFEMALAQRNDVIEKLPPERADGQHDILPTSRTCRIARPSLVRSTRYEGNRSESLIEGTATANSI